jgi:hypothetical protein
MRHQTQSINVLRHVMLMKNVLHLTTEHPMDSAMPTNRIKIHLLTMLEVVEVQSMQAGNVTHIFQCQLNVIQSTNSQ